MELAMGLAAVAIRIGCSKVHYVLRVQADGLDSIVRGVAPSASMVCVEMDGTVLVRAPVVLGGMAHFVIELALVVDRQLPAAGMERATKFLGAARAHVTQQMDIGLAACATRVTPTIFPLAVLLHAR